MFVQLTKVMGSVSQPWADRALLKHLISEHLHDKNLPNSCFNAFNGEKI
jgi:hypothetical protein